MTKVFGIRECLSPAESRCGSEVVWFAQERPWRHGRLARVTGLRQWSIPVAKSAQKQFCECGWYRGRLTFRPVIVQEEGFFFYPSRNSFSFFR